MSLTKPNNNQAGFNIIQTLILVLSGLVIAVVLVASYSKAQSKARDAQRISDILQIQQALKYFHQEFGYYPQAGPEHQAVGLDNAFSRFMSPWPTPPTPADGNCTARTNIYYYEQVAGGENYQIKFCLGQDYGNAKAGIRSASATAYQ